MASSVAFFLALLLLSTTNGCLSQSFLPFSPPSMPPSQIFLINLVLLTNHANMPAASTIFLPLNQSIAIPFPSTYDLDTVSYHIASVRVSYHDLLQTSSPELPTLLPGRTIRVSMAGMNVIVDEQEIIAPDLYIDDNVVVHGVARALNPDFFMSQSSSSATRISPIPGP